MAFVYFLAIGAEGRSRCCYLWTIYPSLSDGHGRHGWINIPLCLSRVKQLPHLTHKEKREKGKTAKTLGTERRMLQLVRGRTK